MCLGNDRDPPAQVEQNRVTNEPPGFLQGPLERFVQQAENQAQTPIEFFPGQTFAGPAEETELGLQLATERAIAGSPLVGQAGNQLSQTLQGDFLENPFQENLTNSIVNSVLPGVTQQFQQAGRSVSPGFANALTTQVTDRLAPLAFQNFQNERRNQLQAAQLAPGIAAQDFADADVLRQVGAAREATAQQGINDAIARFNFQQAEPIERLSLLGTRLQGGNFGGISSATGSVTQPSTSSFANVAGAGLGGLGLLLSLIGP